MTPAPSGGGQEKTEVQSTEICQPPAGIGWHELSASGGQPCGLLQTQVALPAQGGGVVVVLVVVGLTQKQEIHQIAPKLA